MSRPRTFQPYDEEDDKFQQSVMDLFRLKLQNLLSKKDEKNFSFTLTPFSKADSVEEMIKEVEQIILGTYNFEDWFEKRYPNELELLDKFTCQDRQIIEDDFYNMRDKNLRYCAYRDKASFYVSILFHQRSYESDLVKNLVEGNSKKVLLNIVENYENLNMEHLSMEHNHSYEELIQEPLKYLKYKL